MPDGISTFEFLFITSVIGFALLFFVFFNELFRLDSKHIKQCAILSIESFSYNLLLILGSKDMDSTTVSSIVSSYFIFIPIIEFIIYKTIPKKNIVVAVLFVLFGVFLIQGLNVESFLNKQVIFLIMTDVMIAINIITIGTFAKGSNPAILAMGQLFFTSIIAFILWMIEARVYNLPVTIPQEPLFWGSVIFISFFIRGLYTVVQIYAQRYVGPVNAALVFSSEIIMTLFTASLVAKFLHYEFSDSPITILKVCGVVIMLVGILVSDSSFINILKKVKAVDNT